MPETCIPATRAARLRIAPSAHQGKPAAPEATVAEGDRAVALSGESGSGRHHRLAGSYRVAAPGGPVREEAVPAGALPEAREAGAARTRADVVARVHHDPRPDMTAADGRQPAAIACAVQESLPSGAPASATPGG